MLGTLVLTMRQNENRTVSESHSEESGWQQVGEPIYSCGDCETNREIRRASSKDSFWLYVAISILYFTLIAVVLVILLLAPKWTPSMSLPITVQKPSTSPEQIEVDIDKLITSPSDEGSAYNSNESFEGSPKDPLYDIDPRSSTLPIDGQPLFVSERETRDYRKTRLG